MSDEKSATKYAIQYFDGVDYENMVQTDAISFEEAVNVWKECLEKFEKLFISNNPYAEDQELAFWVDVGDEEFLNYNKTIHHLQGIDFENRGGRVFLIKESPIGDFDVDLPH